MKALDLSPIRDIDTQYERIVASVEEYYKCEWDDSIHESYGRYVHQLRELSRQVKAIRCKIETIEKEADGLKIEEIAHNADNLCREAEAI